MEITNGEVTLHVALDGPDAAPPVLLLHGITNSTAAWDFLVPALTDRYRVLRLDFRGHGRSGRTPGAYRSSTYLSDAVAVCEQVAQQPVHLVGHSLGGGTGAALAQQRPDLVRAMVLEDPPLARPGSGRIGGSLNAAFAQMRAAIPRLQAGGGIPIAKLVEVLTASPGPTGARFGDVLEPDGITSMATSLLQVDASVLDPVLEGTIEFVFDPDRPIPVPTLILAADPASPDCVATPEALAVVTATSPLVTARSIAGASHLLHDEKGARAEFTHAVMEFLAGH